MHPLVLRVKVAPGGCPSVTLSSHSAPLAPQFNPGKLFPAHPSPPNQQMNMGHVSASLPQGQKLPDLHPAEDNPTNTAQTGDPTLTSAYGNRVMLCPHHSITMDLRQQHTLQPLSCQELLTGSLLHHPHPPPASIPCAHREATQSTAGA